MPARPSDYKHILDTFTASISERADCGQFCAPLNGGSALCCTTQTAIPIVSKAEWKHLKQRTDIWTDFKPFDATSKQIVDELHESCKAVECTVAPACQRNGRTLACRAFPFFPYFTKEGEMVGVGYYWIFEDRCWVLSNLGVVEQPFLEQFLDAYGYLFERDEEEREAFIDQSAQARRVFSRWGRPIPILMRDGSLMKVPPKSGGKLVPAKLSEFGAHGAYASQKAYEQAIRDAGYDPTGHKLVKSKAIAG